MNLKKIRLGKDRYKWVRLTLEFDDGSGASISIPPPYHAESVSTMLRQLADLVDDARRFAEPPCSHEPVAGFNEHNTSVVCGLCGKPLAYRAGRWVTLHQPKG